LANQQLKASPTFLCLLRLLPCCQGTCTLTGQLSKPSIIVVIVYDLHQQQHEGKECTCVDIVAGSSCITAGVARPLMASFHRAD
jgi:hypothetical protein